MFIQNPDPDFFPIPDPGVKKAPIPDPDPQHWERGEPMRQDFNLAKCSDVLFMTKIESLSRS